MSRLDAPLEPAEGRYCSRAFAALPAAVAERLAARGLDRHRAHRVRRTGPAGAEMIAPQPSAAGDARRNAARRRARSGLQPSAVARPCGAWPTPACQDGDHDSALLRLRYKLIVHGRARAHAARGGSRQRSRSGSREPDEIAVGEAARSTARHAASARSLPRSRASGCSHKASGTSAGILLDGPIATPCARAGRGARRGPCPGARGRTGSRGSRVEPVLPPDVIGLYVLVPAGSEPWRALRAEPQLRPRLRRVYAWKAR